MINTMFDYEVKPIDAQSKFKTQKVKGSNIIGGMNRFAGDNVTKGLGVDVMKDVKISLISYTADQAIFHVTDIISTNWKDWGLFEITKVEEECKTISP